MEGRKIMPESFENYRNVYRMLEDEESRDTYLNRLMYLISGDYKYIENTLTAYKPDMPSVSALMGKLLASLPRERKIVLYGAGGGGARVLQHVKNDKRFTGFCSNNLLKQKNGYLGYPVMSPEELLGQKDMMVLVYAPSAKKEILQLLRDGGYPQDSIWDLETAAMRVDPGQYFAPEFITYADEEIFVDAGSYHLEDVLKFQKYCKRLRSAYAFEPDLENYEYCVRQKEAESLPQVRVFPFGTWSEEKVLRFSGKGNTSSKICEEAGNSVKVVPIDEMIQPEDRITFIKMDVEGAELESLKGAVKTIRRDLPKLAVCIYHKTKDMVEIPLFIKELAPEYQLYVRMHANDGSETVLYAIPPEV